MNFRQLAITFVSTGAPFGLFIALIFAFQFGQAQQTARGAMVAFLRFYPFPDKSS